jgi:hypothetical protein
MGGSPHAVKWMFDSYYSEESLGFAYTQIGQENCFLNVGELVLDGTRLQIDTLLARGDVSFMKMCDTGRAFREKFPKETPPTSVVAPNNWDSTDVQSFYYDCKNYTANLFRLEDKIFFRSIFLFDDRIKDLYSVNSCTTFDAIYENLPIVDTMTCPAEARKQCGLMIDENAVPYMVEKISDGVLRVRFGQKSVIFYEDRIEIAADRLLWYHDAAGATATLTATGFAFEHKGYDYFLDIEGADIRWEDGNFVLLRTDEKITLFPKKASSLSAE